jgi:hypothetical protein
LDAFKDADEATVTFPHALSRLAEADIYYGPDGEGDDMYGDEDTDSRKASGNT